MNNKIPPTPSIPATSVNSLTSILNQDLTAPSSNRTPSAPTLHDQPGPSINSARIGSNQKRKFSLLLKEESPRQARVSGYRERQADSKETLVTKQDREPYVALEKKYQSIFSHPSMRERIAKEKQYPFGTLIDAEMDKVEVINTYQDGYNAIGTNGVATCIAICARGMSEDNEPILGILHSSSCGGSENFTDQSSDEIDETRINKSVAKGELQRLKEAMEEKGATSISMFLVGGMIWPKHAGDGGGTLAFEKALLSFHEEYSILGAKLHLSEADDADGKNGGSTSVVLTPTEVVYGPQPLFKSAD